MNIKSDIAKEVLTIVIAKIIVSTTGESLFTIDKTIQKKLNILHKITENHTSLYAFSSLPLIDI